ncbi:hypothetical protein D9M72_226500 [compost metagenome]
MPGWTNPASRRESFLRMPGHDRLGQRNAGQHCHRRQCHGRDWQCGRPDRPRDLVQGHPRGCRRCRAGDVGDRRADDRQPVLLHVGREACRVSEYPASLLRQHADWRRIVCRASAYRRRCDPRRPLPQHRHRVWRDTTWRPQRFGHVAGPREAGPISLRRPVRALQPANELRPRRHAAHASIRDDTGPTGGSRGIREAVGTVESGGVPPRDPDARRCRMRQGCFVAVHRAGLLPGHRRRGRHRRYRLGSRGRPAPPARLRARDRRRTPPSPDFVHAGPDRDRGARIGRTGLPAGEVVALGDGRGPALRCLHDQPDPVSRGSRLLPEGRRRPLCAGRPDRAGW